MTENERLDLLCRRAEIKLCVILSGADPSIMRAMMAHQLKAGDPEWFICTDQELIAYGYCHGTIQKVIDRLKKKEYIQTKVKGFGAARRRFVRIDHARLQADIKEVVRKWGEKEPALLK